MDLMHRHIKTTDISASDMLRAKGFRVTSGKIHLLALLEKAGSPLSIQSILKIWKGKQPDQTTLYRSLADLHTSGIVRRIDLNTGVAHFEYAPSRPHHHHIVCTNCGVIEEIEQCSVGTLQKKIVHKSPLFKSITTHNLEFFGHCNKCAV